jgi:DNA repair protein RecO (recombination protein O)
VTTAPQTVELLGALLAGDWAVADASEPIHRREATGLVAAYLQWHVENGLRSLRLVDRTSDLTTRRVDVDGMDDEERTAQAWRG